MEMRFILVFLLGLFCCSCGLTTRPEPNLPQPIFESYPLTVVLYLKPEFKNASANIDPVYGWTFEIGQASVEIVTKTLKAMFNRVITVEKITEIPQNFSAVIEPDIRAFKVEIEKLSVEIAYTFNVYDNQKQLIDTVSVSGKEKRQFFKFNLGKYLTEQAMKDAMAQLMVKFQNDPEIQTWLKARSETRTLKELKR
ncbi:MAG: hypothetical protein IPN42_01035 [Methylococcaceae bacterium]|nr:hypothetical protein [Methylococcaceae bacterium]